jgi:hypothetical protein
LFLLSILTFYLRYFYLSYQLQLKILQFCVNPDVFRTTEKIEKSGDKNLLEHELRNKKMSFSADISKELLENALEHPELFIVEPSEEEAERYFYSNL